MRVDLIARPATPVRPPWRLMGVAQSALVVAVLQLCWTTPAPANGHAGMDAIKTLKARTGAATTAQCPQGDKALGRQPRDLGAFLRQASRHLPRFRPLFEAAASRHGLPWPLLAAQAFAESRWDPQARSPTGVLGMMQLTRAAAAEVGVSDRLDPGQSIRGGALYLARLMNRVPRTVNSARDREAFALAAYNIGFAHVLDARRVVRAMGANPDTWAGLRRALGVLGITAAYDSYRRHGGRVAGRGAIAYVERVHSLRRVLRGLPGGPQNGSSQTGSASCVPRTDKAEADFDSESAA